jgi:hypothetical protein
MNRRTYVLLALVLAGAALRLRGLDWGLPWALHIDERLFVVAKAIRLERSLAGEGIPDPGITSYGILPLWLLVAARKLLLGWVTGSGAPTYGSDFAGTVLLARGISALWGTGTVLLAGLWGRRWGPTTGLVAAALVAGFPALVQASHFGTVEAPLLALLTGGMLASERLAEDRTLRRSLVAGVILGMAVSVKAPGAILALPALHAARGGGGSRFLGRAALIAGAALLILLALNPGLFVPPGPSARTGEHLTLFGNLSRVYSGEFRDWTLPYRHDVPVWTELTRILPYAVGLVPEALALIGLVIVARRRSSSDVRLLLLVVPILLLFLPARVKTVRFLLPALPGLAILAAEATRALAKRTRLLRTVPAAVAALTLLHGLAFSAVYAETDSRVRAARWVDENVGERDIVAIEDPPGYGPPIGSPSRKLERPLLRLEMLWKGFYVIHERSTEEERRRHLDKVLRRADYLALSEQHREEFTVAGDLRPVESAFYADLDAGRLPFEKVAEFKTYPRLGPIVLNDDQAEILMRGFDHPRIEIWRRVERETKGEGDR